MIAKQIRYPGRKWLKHVSLWSDPLLREYLPDTMLFTPKNFIEMIDKYTVLFLKPDLGMKGKGVMKVTHDKDDYIIRTASCTHKYRSKKHAALKLKQLIKDKRYIVQQGIDLIQIQGNPIDFRALLHLKPDGDWRFFGIMGKVAAPNRFVTNHSNGGKAIRLYTALGVTKEDGQEWYKRIKEISLKIAAAMKEHFPKIAELGLDIAIDTDRKIWLVEANTKPQYQLFRYHSNPRLFGQIAASVRAIRSTSA
ncbi:YheC/YheD family protein [Paenibacillus harenae]|uniref:Glutathione synthase/RimK-type ligase-like ATP-grasp enzyme n=1 Tax=Paenibacillus harenae TaxID=306543 RepID=A0ABT9U2S5_PAEHA|nr:YheC/YheD family protein [Paenibacillus harenae]MDQ0113931.1 glutathione synthase/RimK-type ligase-like ATP-grasp enzyme [Paenibacillus harenae]